MSQALQISVLGPFRVMSSSGESIPLVTRKAQALIAYLALEGQEAPRDRIAGLLWPDHNDDRARHNLRQVLSRIRSLCGPVIQTQGDVLKLDTELCQVDVVEFVRLTRPSQLRDESALHTCLDLYAGDLLYGYVPKEPEFEDWLLTSSQRLRDLVCTSADHLIDILVDAGRHQEAIEKTNIRLEMDPGCESAHRRLMELYLKTGRRTDALRQYRTCKEALHRELGVQPSDVTIKLFHSIRSGLSGTVDSSGPAQTDPVISTGEKPRVAVLPFQNLSQEVGDYFADGITEDIITALSRFHSLQVIARGSCFVYKDKDTADQEIAAALGAGYIVRGSVQRAGNKIRLNIQLLDGPAGLNIWAHRFDRELTDVFVVQDEITATVVSTLADRVEASQLAHTRSAPDERLEAYDYLLRGKDHHHRFTAEDCAKCIDLFKQAIDRDPTFAVAHAWLACGLGQAMVWGLDERSHLVDLAQEAAERGLELDEDESECHRILAQVWLTRGNLERSLRHQEKALFLNPNDDRIVCAMGEILVYAGRAAEAEQWVRQSLVLNPYHPQRYWTHLVRALIHQGKFEAAVTVSQQIGRPRQDDLVYNVVASVHVNDKALVKEQQTALLTAHPDFDARSFVGNLPYERDEDRKLILDSLEMGSQSSSSA